MTGTHDGANDKMFASALPMRSITAAFVELDCSIIGIVFGPGIAERQTGEDRRIDQYRGRNEDLRELEADYRRN